MNRAEIIGLRTFLDRNRSDPALAELVRSLPPAAEEELSSKVLKSPQSKSS